MLQAINLRRMFLGKFPSVAVFKTSSFLNKGLESVSQSWNQDPASHITQLTDVLNV